MLRPLTAALLTQLFDELVRLANVSPKKALPRPVLAIVDEAGTIGQVGDLPGWLATLRSARVGVVLAFQALSQATRLYSAEGRELIEENCQTHLLFGGAGNASAGWMSAALGERTVVGEAASKTRDREHLFAGTGGRSKSKQEVGAPLMRAEEITELPPGTLIARIPHRRPLLVRVAPWYRSPRLRRRAGCWEQPPQPSVTQESGAAEAAATAPRA